MVSALWWHLFDFSYITLQELFVYALINDFSTATSLWPSPSNSHLNSSTIDGLAEGAWKDGGAQEPVAYGNHDNPVSGNLQAPSHWYLPQGRREGRESICWAQAKTGTAHVRLSWPQQHCCKTTRPPVDLWPFRMLATGDVADQRCFAFNLLLRNYFILNSLYCCWQTFILCLFLGQKEKESWKIWVVSRKQVIQNVLSYTEVRKGRHCWKMS